MQTLDHPSVDPGLRQSKTADTDAWLGLVPSSKLGNQPLLACRSEEFTEAQAALGRGGSFCMQITG